MAKNFGTGIASQTFENVAKISDEKANVPQLKMVANEKLMDYPYNNEDITDTEDLEQSMKELGFTDPLEVTKYSMEPGNYMIISGHRRRAAGVNVGITTFPCVVRNFHKDLEVQNYVLLANSQRDSSKDPLLLCKRYKMHSDYLKEVGFTGKIREEVAKRLGLSAQQADRYNRFNKIIPAAWELVRDDTDDTVGMSSLLPMASYGEKEQAEILEILKEYMNDGVTLTRQKCKFIIEEYGKKGSADDGGGESDDVAGDNDDIPFSVEEQKQDSAEYNGDLPLNPFLGGSVSGGGGAGSGSRNNSSGSSGLGKSSRDNDGFDYDNDFYDDSDDDGYRGGHSDRGEKDYKDTESVVKNDTYSGSAATSPSTDFNVDIDIFEVCEILQVAKEVLSHEGYKNFDKEEYAASDFVELLCNCADEIKKALDYCSENDLG